MSKTQHQTKEDGGLSYHGHAESSARMTEEILGRLKFPNSVIDEVCFMIKNHMIIKDVPSPIPARRIRRTARKLGDRLKDCLELIHADNCSHAEEYCMPGQVKEFMESYENMTITLGVTQKFNIPLNGDVIIKELGIPRGPGIKAVQIRLQSWFDNDPSLTAQDLLEKYRSLSEVIGIGDTVTLIGVEDGKVDVLEEGYTPPIILAKGIKFDGLKDGEKREGVILSTLKAEQQIEIQDQILMGMFTSGVKERMGNFMKTLGIISARVSVDNGNWKITGSFDGETEVEGVE